MIGLKVRLAVAVVVLALGAAYVVSISQATQDRLRRVLIDVAWSPGRPVQITWGGGGDRGTEHVTTSPWFKTIITVTGGGVAVVAREEDGDDVPRPRSRWISCTISVDGKIVKDSGHRTSECGASVIVA